MTLTEARGLRKRKAAEGQKAGCKKGPDKTQPESSDDADVQSSDATPSSLARGSPVHIGSQ
jgi:hypothetical protein